MSNPVRARRPNRRASPLFASTGRLPCRATSFDGIMSGVVSRRPTRLEMLIGVVYLVIVLSLTWLALADPYTYAYYWVRFVVLLPSSLIVFGFDYFVAILLFGPDPTTWVATLYFTAVAIAGGVVQLALAWFVRNRAI